MLSEAARVSGGVLSGSDSVFNAVSTDTRTIASGDLFVALRGEHFDGHDYVSTALQKGACAAVVEKAYAGSGCLIKVKDTCLALGQIAALNRKKFSGKVIAVTGSSGKTTVKGMLASILGAVAETLATQGNFNNHIGVPKTLMKLREQAYAVVEAGTSGVGEIDYLTQLIQPQVALVNNVMPAHMQGFGAIEAIAEEKSHIYGGQKLCAGVVNLDDAFAALFLKKLKGQKVIAFSLSDNPRAKEVASDFVYASQLVADELGCYGFVMHQQDLSQLVQLRVPGRHNVANALAAAGCALAAGLALPQLVAGLQSYRGEKGRMQFVESRRCKYLVDDSYNANPGSMRAAIDYLSERADGVLIAGAMAELGENAAQEHRQIGQYAKQKGVSALIAVGEFASETVSGFGEKGLAVKQKQDLIAILNEMDLAHSVVLVKGSRSSKMEDVVCQLNKQGGGIKC